MKPLPSAPLTDEDRAVNFEFAVARRGCCWIAQLLCASWDADRRDAELMLAITSGEDVGAFHWIQRGPDWRDWVIAPDYPVSSGQKFT
jgi:hypothetical protein